MEEDIKETIFNLEKELQKPDVRKSIEKLDELISDDFQEITSSGVVTTKSDCFVNLPAAPEINFEMTDFKINILSKEIIQSLFKTKKTIVGTDKVSYSMRSSLWKNENGKWKMLFHQGTPTPF